eukprot:1157234-Pelagomonas_calceolata.AAC.9
MFAEIDFVHVLVNRDPSSSLTWMAYGCHLHASVPLTSVPVARMAYSSPLVQLNEADGPMLLTGCSDGTVRVLWVAACKTSCGDRHAGTPDAATSSITFIYDATGWGMQGHLALRCLGFR